MLDTGSHRMQDLGGAGGQSRWAPKRDGIDPADLPCSLTPAPAGGFAATADNGGQPIDSGLILLANVSCSTR